MSRPQVQVPKRAYTTLLRRIEKLETYWEGDISFRFLKASVAGLVTGTLYFTYTQQQDMKEEINRLKTDRDQHQDKLFDLGIRTMGIKSQASESEMMRMIRDMEHERKQRERF